MVPYISIKKIELFNGIKVQELQKYTDIKTPMINLKNTQRI